VPGQVRLHLPVLGRRRIEAQDCFWVRARITRAWSPDHPAGAQDDAYFKSPRLRQLSAVSWGGTVPATHAQYVMHEFLGQSDGSPGQRFPLQRHPILQRQPGETLTVQVENQPPQSWTETTDFADATGSDRHFSLDGANGELRLGPAVRQPDGTIKLYGAIPPRGANLIFERYRVGGGQAGNVHAGLLNTLKTSIPYVDRVENRKPAIGGLDAETLEDALVRAPALLRSRDRAVTEADFEFLASQALPEAIGRVKCLQPRPDEAGRVLPGQVYVLIIPRVADPDGYIAPEQLEPRSEQIAALAAYLDERRLLTTRVNIQRPEYQAVAVKVRLRAAIGADQATVRATVLSRLYRFLNPLTGWTDGKGWLFGRTLYLSDIYQCLQGLRDVQFIRSADLRLADKDGVAQGESQESVEIVAHGVIISGRHEVELV
jgi:predicted phage baseplate assembly protein